MAHCAFTSVEPPAVFVLVRFLSNFGARTSVLQMLFLSLFRTWSVLGWLVEFTPVQGSLLVRTWPWEVRLLLFVPRLATKKD